MPENFDKIPNTLDVTIYGAMEPVTPTLSKSRVRIFYKGMNRNRTFISEDFANQLIASLPYTPVKGIFNKDAVDYEDHGEDNTDGRIYGIVPAETNFAWEDHMDVDGVTRTYACADVLLFTGLYPEAKLVPGESQSMEIFRGNLKGEWRISEEDNQPYYHFLQGCLVGLQVLGQEVEPCFEGAAFYSLSKDIQELVDYIRNYSKKEVKVTMDKSKFRISDNEKADILFDLINPNFNEEGNWELNAIVVDVYDDYALCVSPSGYQRVYYSKDGDNVTIGDSVAVKIVDVTETEYNALETMKAVGGSFEAANTAYADATAKVAELEATNAEFSARIAEFEAQENTEEVPAENAAEENSAEDAEPQADNSLEEPVAEESATENSVEPAAENEPEADASAEFTARIEALEAEKVEMEKKISDITNENESLIAFKKAIEKTQKENILSQYEEYLDEAKVTEFQSNIDAFSVEDFEKEVCTAAVKSGSSIFSNRHNEPDMFFKGGNVNGGDKKMSRAAQLINNYKNGGNK